jgi:hypothetical protein
MKSKQFFLDNFQVKQINDDFVCYGTLEGYDYSFKSDSAEMAKLLAEAYLKKNGLIYDETRNEILAAQDEVVRIERLLAKQKEDAQKFYKDMAERQRSKLMTVYYMLEALKQTGTHREKETVIMFHKVMLEKMINSSDGLPIAEQDDLPF